MAYEDDARHGTHCACLYRWKKRFAAKLLQRRLQIELPFPAPKVVSIDHRPRVFGPYSRKGRVAHEWDRQPAGFPHAWWKLLDADGPRWREKYVLAWIAKREAAGLPSHVNESYFERFQLPNLNRSRHAA